MTDFVSQGLVNHSRHPMIVGMSKPILEVREVTRSYGSFQALRGVTFHVETGELFGLLGPNGAGKTTLMSILACLSDPTSGEVYFAGERLSRKHPEQRLQIGIGTQDLAVYPDLTARENLTFFGRLYGMAGADLKQRVDEVLELTALQDKADLRAGTFSGGMKRRLNLGVAVVHRPKLLILDEPTTGVDPQSRNHIFERVQQLNAAGMTVIYTSHYMEEVQTLCPRIGILDHGQLIACDTLPKLLAMLEGSLILHFATDCNSIVERLKNIPHVQLGEVTSRSIQLATSDVNAALLAVIQILQRDPLELIRIESHEPNLERVFLHLTNHALRD
jgi:ABC-2 type transport system ATP-binding protein